MTDPLDPAMIMADHAGHRKDTTGACIPNEAAGTSLYSHCLPYRLADALEKANERGDRFARLDQRSAAEKAALREEMAESRIPALERMAREANAAAIEQWNRADALAAENATLRAQLAEATPTIPTMTRRGPSDDRA